MVMKYNADELHFWAPTKKLGGGWLLWKDSPAPPQAPDPVATANAQTASNADTARLNAQLNRVNQYTPWGSLTYSQNTTPDTFDQQGYDAAMAAYQQSLREFQATQGRPRGNGLYAGPEAEDGWAMNNQPAPQAPTAPTREQFTTRGNSDTWNSTVTLAPEQQALLDSSNRISQSMANLGEDQISRVAAALRGGLDLSSAPQVQNNALQTSAGVNPQYTTNVGYGQIQNNNAPAGAIRNTIDGAGAVQRSLSAPGQIQSAVNTDGIGDYRRSASYGQIQDRLDLSKVPELVGGDRLADDLSTQRDSLYRQQAAFLDPQWQQDQRDLENRLVQQGVMQNSDAWNRAMGDFARQKEFAYNNARMSAITGGGAEQSRLFGLGLAANQNAYSQALGAGQFANAAQQQGFGQSMANAQLNNSATAQQFQQRLAEMQAANAAQQQGFGQNLAAGQFANAAQGQQYTQNASDATFANAAQNQQYTQNAGDMALANAAQAQGFGQASTNAQLNNAVSQNLFNQGLMNAQLNNQASGQAFNQSLAGRNQAINEIMLQQQNPLNVLNALRTGSQVSSPQFSSVPQTNVAPTDVVGPINTAYQGQMAAYNSQVAQNNAMTQGLFQLGGAALMAPAGTFAAFSDRRLKTDVKRIDTHRLGIGIYSYNYVWGEPAVGVMADEVEQVLPEAVLTHSSGFKMVNYGML